MEQTEVSLALVAAMSVASELGLRVEDAIVIQNANRLAVRLVPGDVLARVAIAVQRNQKIAAFELELTRQLENLDSPVAVRQPRVEPRVNVRDGFAITFWKYYEPLPTSDITPAEYAQALERLHADMQQLDMQAPHFTDRVDEAQAIVQNRSLSPELADADRDLLTDSLRNFRHAVIHRGTSEQLLHGEPHVGNVLKTASGLRFIDFETCCYGPVEFDIAHAPGEVDDHYPHTDRLQLRYCRILKVAMVAAWRSNRDDQFPNGHEMRTELISELRSTLER
jgi:Ser/Thr protein kinase RdoA (MazF antagonist)